MNFTLTMFNKISEFLHFEHIIFNFFLINLQPLSLQMKKMLATSNCKQYLKSFKLYYNLSFILSYTEFLSYLFYDFLHWFYEIYHRNFVLMWFWCSNLILHWDFINFCFTLGILFQTIHLKKPYIEILGHSTWFSELLHWIFVTLILIFSTLILPLPFIEKAMQFWRVLSIFLKYKTIN